jgi:hypothetical protein
MSFLSCKLSLEGIKDIIANDDAQVTSFATAEKEEDGIYFLSTIRIAPA